jgi:hypothetical protein
MSGVGRWVWKSAAADEAEHRAPTAADEAEHRAPAAADEAEHRAPAAADEAAEHRPPLRHKRRRSHQDQPVAVKPEFKPWPAEGSIDAARLAMRGHAVVVRSDAEEKAAAAAKSGPKRAFAVKASPAKRPSFGPLPPSTRPPAHMLAAAAAAREDSASEYEEVEIERPRCRRRWYARSSRGRRRRS